MKNEFELISEIKKLTEKKLGFSKSFSEGIGDDCAFIKHIKGDEDILVSTDILAEGVHFDLSYYSMEDVGYKSAVVNISDIIAKGGTPSNIFVSVSIPKNITDKDIIRFYNGLIKACKPYGVSVSGGDTTLSKNGLFISIAILGKAKKGKSYYRSSAKAGDYIYVLGRLGESSIGLGMLQKKIYDRKNIFVKKHLRPSLFYNEFQTICKKYDVHAAMDISDGLVSDALHIAKASSVLCRINEYADFSKVNALYKKDKSVIKDIFSGGEDYAILFTTPNFIKEETLWKKNILCIGRVLKLEKKENPSVLVYRDENTLSKNEYRGYIHF